MVYQPPTGARDLLPLEVSQQRWIEARLQTSFQRWGYRQIMTSTLEHLEALTAGGAVDRATVLQVQATDDDSDLGLRPELTASIARAAATRLANQLRPLRLFYLANVFRKGRKQEIYQAGVELLGSGTMLADAETLLLLCDCLSSAGVTQVDENPTPAQSITCSLVLGEAALTRSLLEPFPEHQRSQVLQAIAHLDRVTLEALDLASDLKTAALTLLDLRGSPTAVLARLRQLPLNKMQLAIADRLQALTDLLSQRLQTRASQEQTVPEVILDLSLVQTFDYYTGIVFEAACRTQSGTWVVGQGGRYDQLLGLYNPTGESSPGIGFCLEIENLQQVLKTADRLPREIAQSDWLVVPRTPEAYGEALAYANKLKDTPELVRVELYLEDAASPATVRDYARQQAISRIAWIGPGAFPEIEALQ